MHIPCCPSREQFERAVTISFGYPRTSIRDPDPCGPITAHQTHVDRFALWRVRKRVAQHVVDRDAQARRVGGHRHALCRPETDALPAEGGSARLDGLTEKRLSVDTP